MEVSTREISSLSLMRILDDDSNRILQIWNPETNAISNFNAEDINTLKKAYDTIETSLANIKLTEPTTNNYKHWLNRVWYKSLDYYMASRAPKPITEIPVREINIKLCKKIPNQSKILKLNNLEIPKDNNIETALIKRRTRRVFTGQEIQLTQLGNILCGSLNDESLNKEKSNKPLFNGFNYYCVIYRIEDVEPGIYFYNPLTEELGQVSQGQFDEVIVDNIQGLNAPKTAAFTLFITADFDYLQLLAPDAKGLRNSYIEAGRVAQHIIITAMQSNIYCLQTPAISDRNITKLLNLHEPHESPLYSLTFGLPYKE